MTVTVEATGEVLDFPDSSYEEIVESYQLVKAYAEAYEKIRKSLAKKAELFIGSNGTSEPYKGFIFRCSVVQRKNYDKSVLRQVLDEDTLDLFLEPNKTAIDRYLKDNLEDLGEKSTIIRESMIPVGNPYQVTKLERISR